MLREFGQYLQGETRSYCTSARMGGDEFGMLIPHIAGSDALLAATRLIEGLSSHTFSVGDQDLRISASAGVVLFPEHGEDTTELLSRADTAMYGAKTSGGNRVAVYVPEDAQPRFVE